MGRNTTTTRLWEGTDGAIADAGSISRTFHYSDFEWSKGPMSAVIQTTVFTATNAPDVDITVEISLDNGTTYEQYAILLIDSNSDPLDTPSTAKVIDALIKADPTRIGVFTIPPCDLFKIVATETAAGGTDAVETFTAYLTVG